MGFRDIVQALKQEWASLGGHSADESPFPKPVGATQDAIECAGLVLNDWNSGTPTRDQNTTVKRDGNNLILTTGGSVSCVAPTLWLPNASGIEVLGGDGVTRRSLLSHTGDTATLGNANTTIEVASPINRIVTIGSELALWKLDEGASPFANSGSSGANDMVLGGSGSPHHPDMTPVGRGYYIPNSAIYLKSALTGPQPSHPMSMTLWVRLNMGTTGVTAPIFVKFYNLANYNSPSTAIGWFNAPNVSFGLTRSGVRTTSHAGVLVPGAWHLLGATYDGNSVKTYRDGQLVTDTLTPGSIDYGATPGHWVLGNRYDTPSTSLGVSVARAAIYSVVLTQAQLQKMFNTGMSWY